jgi:hypothetical protein
MMRPMRYWGWLLLGCLLTASAGAEEKLGRLFFTPAERANLDYLRQTSQPPQTIVKPDESGVEKDEAKEVPATEAKPQERPLVSVGGYVKRSDGSSTVWVNGRPMQEKAMTKDVELGKLGKNSNRVPLKLQDTGKTIELKPGQTYDLTNGKVLDSLKDLPANTPAPISLSGEKRQPVQRRLEQDARPDPVSPTDMPAESGIAK